MDVGKSIAYLVVLYFCSQENLVEANTSVVGLDCLDLLHRGFNSSGVYQIDPDGIGAYQVLCDQETNGGGWVVLQKRFNGAVDFVNRIWNEYKNGFGNLSTEFWLGNERLHRLSSMNQQLLVEIEDFNGEKAHASYNEFSVYSETEKYKLEVKEYSGTANDSLSVHSGLLFSTIDQDNDPDTSKHCSQTHGGGWWYKLCGMAFLNGHYVPSPDVGITWINWKNSVHRLKQTTMKIRTLRERPWDYYLRFTGAQSQDFAFVPIVLDFEALTVSWWMRGGVAQHWSAVFSIVNILQRKTAAFSYSGDRRYKVTLDNNTREISSEHGFADSKWHHFLLAWDVKNGILRFYVDIKVLLNGQTTRYSEPFPSGRLILGQLQDAFGSINANESLKADIMHFNMWQRMFTEQEIMDIHSECNVNIGTLVPWPEMLLSLHGNVTRTPFVKCFDVQAKYDWPLTEVSNNKLQERLASRQGSDMDVSNVLHTELGVLSRQYKSTVSLGSFAGECVGNLDLCKSGLSFSFWMNYNVPFVSHILGLNSKYQETLRAWLEPFLPKNARWLPCYSGVQHGFTAHTFHEKCAREGVTVTLVKVRNFVFGGFSDQRWGGTTVDQQDMWSARSFLFSIVNPAGIGPVKLNIRPEKTDKALRQDPQSGPVFGENDLYIGDGADQSAVSFSDLGRAYELPYNPLGAAALDARKFFAGSYKFIVDDIEVFYYTVNHFHVGEGRTSYSASDTFTNTGYAPYRARPSSPSPWCSNKDVLGHWLTIDLGTSQSVNKIKLEKKSSDTSYVLTYTVKYGNDGESWTNYNNSEVLDGQNLTVVNIPSVRFIRFYPKTWHNEICMRVQVYKEISGVLTDLGINSSSVIPNSRFTASSWKCMSTPSLAYPQNNRKCYAAWCGTGASTWLQIDVKSIKLLTYILTKGPPQGNPVTSFYLAYSFDGTAWQDYAPAGVRQKQYGDWNDQIWTRHNFLPPLKTRFLRILPQECASPCCINVKVYTLKEGQTDYIITSGGEESINEGFAMYHIYNIPQNTSSYHLKFATESKRWSMLLPTFPLRWFHVTITWSAIWGLKYYEDGRLVKEEVNFELTGSNHTFDEITIGRAPSSDSVASAPLTFQMSDLVFWYAFLSEAAVKEGFRLSDANRIWSYDQPMMDFAWQSQTNCIDTNDTGPCYGETERFMYIESSFPRAKGNKARLESRLTVITRNCLTFWYYMHGETTGRLNVYLRSHSNDAETLVWRLAGSHGNFWNKGEIPIREIYAYQVIIEGVVGYLGDIAISDTVLGVNDDCSFTPKKAQVLPVFQALECRESLGMASGAIPDERISASSQMNNQRAASLARLHLVPSGGKQGSWVAETKDANQWLQVDLGSIYTRVTRVATQGRNGYPQWVKKYQLQYGNDGASFQYYRTTGQHTAKEFTGNKDQHTVVSHDLKPPIIARYVRFRPVEWTRWIAMRVELYGCQECHDPLGMQSGVISDGQISASSEWDAHHAAIQGRLNFKQAGIKSGAWSSQIADIKQWLQVDLGSYYTRISRVATQGRNLYDQWVTVYQLQYGKNGVNFRYYKKHGQTANKVFTGNQDRDTVVYHDINPPITARYIRFRPIAWYKHISMRVELYGCQALECQDAFGMETGAITDGQISASSEHSAFLAAVRGRLNVQHSPGKGGSWSSKDLDQNQWLRIDVGSQYTIVTRVATQGRSDDDAQWVTKYMLQYSNSGEDFKDYRQQYHTKFKEFAGNTDQNTVVSHDLSPPISARYVRFRPLEWHNHISMRAELYGCQDIVCELPCLPGQYCDEVTGQCVCGSSLRDEEWCWKRQRYEPLSIDQLQESAAFYWTLDDEKAINNLVGSDFGVAPSEINTVRGIRDKAVKIDQGASGKFTLTEVLDPSECLFNTSQCNEGFTMMLWLWYKHNNAGQVFLASSEDNVRGHRMFQINRDTPQVAYQITNFHKKCLAVFSTPKEVWTHYTLTYRSLDDLDSISVFVNGKEVTNFVFKGCSDGSFPLNNITQLSVGDSGDELPEAAFDEVIIWYRKLASDEIVEAYTYYKGLPNLQVHVNLDFTGTTWDEKLLDHETDTFQDWNQDLTNHVQSLYQNMTGDVDVTIEKLWDASGAVGCEFTAKFTETGYSAVEPVINWLTESTYQINRLEANDIFITAVSLQAQNAPKQRSIDLSITWNGPTELLHGIFQGYEIFYQDTNLGKEFNVTLRTSDAFYEISDLQHYTKYMITARSFTLEGEGRMSEPIYAWTAPTAPVHSPTNITAFNKSSTSVLVTWVTIPTQQGIGQIMGYTIIFFAVKDGNITAQNVSVEIGHLNETILDNLQIFTNYSIQVQGFTEKDKLGPLSHPIYAMTDEDVPSLPPSNVTAQGMNSSSILVSWGPVPKEGRDGIIIGYGLFYSKHDASPANWKQQTCYNTYWCAITNLDVYTHYDIKVTGLTVKGFGVPAIVEAGTEKGVSDQPPPNLAAHNTSSTSIQTTWDPIPPLEKYIATVAYHVTVIQADSFSDTERLDAILGACVNTTKMTLHRTNLRKYTAYRITVAGVTERGVGNASAQLTVLTDEDAPEGSPQNITPAATSATSLTFTWKPLTNELANGVILGYHIIVLDKLRNETRNITVQSLDQANIENLYPYTEYEARIVPFNNKGQGNASDIILVRTKEGAPSSPPSNFTGQAPSSTKLTLEWKPVDKLHINGVLRAYVIVFFITHSPVTRHNITIPVTNARKRRAISDPSSPSYELSGLKKYTTYTVQVMAYTVDYGVPSLQINITTTQDVPSHSPINVTAFNTSSTGINVSWETVPDDHANGIIVGYRLFYKMADKPIQDFRNLTVNSTTLSVELESLEFFTKYELRLLAFTIVGDGNISEPVYGMTDEDVPESAPVNLLSFPANTTALTVSWLPVIEEDRNGIILGYHVSLSNSTGEFMRNISVFGSEVVTLGGLEVWTNYSMKVCAFTVKGIGPWSPIVRGITDEEAPRVAPTNITAFNTSSTSLHVTWQPISTKGLRGILRAYRVYYIEQETYFTRSLKNVTVDSASLEVELVDLYKFTNYTVYVVARTNKDGVSSEKVNASTDEDKPDQDPADVEVWTPHSTRLDVSWNEVPNGYKNGIIMGYKIQYTEMMDNGSVETEDLEPWKRSLSITGLKKFTLYNITVLAYTSKGDGVSYNKVIMTNQDVPDTPPLDIKAESIWTTHSIPVTWTHIPSYLLNGILTGYRITYQAIEIGDCPHDENSREVIVPPENTSTVLRGLESFAVYRIEVTGLTIKGDGPSEVIFAETCRCVKRLTTNWMLLDPYVARDNTTKHGLGGLMTPFLSDMAVTCCQSCRAHGKSYVDFDFNGKGEPSDQPTEDAHRLNINHDTDFSFPVFGYKLQDEFRHEFGYTAMIESPGTAYIINTKFGKELPTSLLDSILACWPLALISIFLAYISGFTIWAVDQVQNSEHFPRSFFPGMWEGFWWAFVSMTTVGYGDRTPFSNPGKLIAVVWTLAGVIIIGILVGFIAVSLTGITVGVDYKLYGAEVAAIFGSAQYNMGVRKNAKFQKDQIHRSFEEIYEELSSKKVGGVLVDAYMVGAKQHLFEKPFLRIYRIYDYSAVYGVVTGGDSRKLGKCFHNYIQKNLARIYEHVADNVKTIQESAEPLEVERSTGLFDSESELFRNNLMILIALLCCAVLGGTLWEVLHRWRKKMKIQPQDNKPTTLPSFEMRKMLQDYKTKTYNLIMELKEKHRRERQSVLKGTKNSRKFLYQQRDIASADSQRNSNEEEDLTTGLVALPASRKAMIFTEHQQERPNCKLVRVSFHIPDGTSQEETKC